MNLHEYILSNGLADADAGEIAASYIKAVLALGDADEQLTALEPSVRSHAGRLAGAVRRSQRSHGPAQPPDGSHFRDGGPGQTPSGNDTRHAGPANGTNDSDGRHGGPAVPAWARKHAALIAWCREHAADNFWIPGAGRRKLSEITADQWEARARQLAEQARGAEKAAAQMREFAALINAARVATIGDILDAVVVAA